jgi:hypothetical protein
VTVVAGTLVRVGVRVEGDDEPVGDPPVHPATSQRRPAPAVWRYRRLPKEGMVSTQSGGLIRLVGRGNPSQAV